MPLSKILVATDHSEHAQRAEEFAGRLAGPGSTLEIQLLYVHPELPRRAGRGGLAEVHVSPERLTAEEKAEMHALLSQAAARIQDAAKGATVTIAEDMVGGSDIGATIAEEAERTGAEAIVMGSRGRSDFAGMILGSVSHKVLHLAHCPVIVVR
jgi:nucleotide-binding universal stress UspA family protein